VGSVGEWKERGDAPRSLARLDVRRSTAPNPTGRLIIRFFEAAALDRHLAGPPWGALQLTCGFGFSRAGELSLNYQRWPRFRGKVFGFRSAGRLVQHPVASVPPQSLHNSACGAEWSDRARSANGVGFGQGVSGSLLVASAFGQVAVTCLRFMFRKRRSARAWFIRSCSKPDWRARALELEITRRRAHQDPSRPIDLCTVKRWDVKIAIDDLEPALLAVVAAVVSVRQEQIARSFRSFGQSVQRTVQRPSCVRSSVSELAQAGRS